MIFFASFRISICLTCILRRNFSQAGTERSRSSLSIARFSQLTCQCPNGSGLLFVWIQVCCFFSKTMWDLLLVLGLGFCFSRPVCSYREPQYDIQSFLLFFFLIGNGASCYQNGTLQLVFNTAMCSISCGRTSHQPDAAFFCRTGGTWLASFLLVRDLHRPGLLACVTGYTLLSGHGHFSLITDINMVSCTHDGE